MEKEKWVTPVKDRAHWKVISLWTTLYLENLCLSVRTTCQGLEKTWLEKIITVGQRSDDYKHQNEQTHQHPDCAADILFAPKDQLLNDWTWLKSWTSGREKCLLF